MAWCYISALAEKFVRDPHEVVKAGQVVRVRVLEVDMKRQRVALTMRLTEKPAPAAVRDSARPGAASGSAQRARPRDMPAAPASNPIAAALARAQARGR